MPLTYYILSTVFIVASLLPFIPHPHWMFRVWEFGRIQLMVLQIATLTLGLVFVNDQSLKFWITIAILAGLSIHNLIILLPYTFLYSSHKGKGITKHSEIVSIISVNVYQYNDQYDELIALVKEIKPDILLTMESNQAWEDALRAIEDEYPQSKKVALENTYGMHFYTKFSAKSLKVNYFIEDELPSIEAHLETDNGVPFTFFGVHPPPPSPTEEDTSEERDGELMSVGKKIVKTNGPVIVVGDFNNVAWAKSSILFRKTSQLIDPRIGRGFVSTYHAKYRLFRFPIDLCFHSPEIFIQDLKTLSGIGSDHLPLYCTFFINTTENLNKERVETLEADEKEDVEEMIQDGKKEGAK